MAIVLRVTPNGTGPRGPWTNVWDILSQADDYADAEAAVNYLGNAYKDHWASIASDQYSINGFKVFGIGSGLPTVEIQPLVGPIFGTGVSDAMPAQVAALLRFGSVSVRPNRARKYMPGMIEALWQNAFWASDVVSGLTALGTEMIDMPDLTPELLEFGVARVAPGGALVTFTRMTQANVDPYAVIQRRRR